MHSFGPVWQSRLGGASALAAGADARLAAKDRGYYATHARGRGGACFRLKKPWCPARAVEVPDDYPIIAISRRSSWNNAATRVALGVCAQQPRFEPDLVRAVADARPRRPCRRYEVSEYLMRSRRAPCDYGHGDMSSSVCGANAGRAERFEPFGSDRTGP